MEELPASPFQAGFVHTMTKKRQGDEPVNSPLENSRPELVAGHLNTRRWTVLLGAAHSPAAWQWITRILAISANLTLEGFFLISLRNSPRATSHLQRGGASWLALSCL